MPLWIKLMMLGFGVVFCSAGVAVGVFGTRGAQAHVAMVEGLRPLSASALEDQPAGADALVEGVISERNRPVFRDFVAYSREEYEVSRDSDGDRRTSWDWDGGETPPLLIEAGGVVAVGNAGYSIERPHETWYDEATLTFDERPRDGSLRYHGLRAGRAVTALGTVVAGPEGNQLQARVLFGGSRAEYLAAQRESAAVLPVLGGIFGAVGLLFLGLTVFFFVRFPR